MQQNAYFLAKIGADTAENEQQFAEILPIGRRVADPAPRDPEEVVGVARDAAVAGEVYGVVDLFGATVGWAANERLETSNWFEV